MRAGLGVLGGRGCPPRAGPAAVGSRLLPRHGRTSISWNKSLPTVPRASVALPAAGREVDSIVRCEVFSKQDRV